MEPSVVVGVTWTADELQEKEREEEERRERGRRRNPHVLVEEGGGLRAPPARMLGSTPPAREASKDTEDRAAPLGTLQLEEGS